MIFGEKILKMLTKTITELQEIIKTADSETAASAVFILRCITNNKPDDFLKKENLYNHLEIYDNYKKYSLSELKTFLERINELPIINIIIINHLIQNFKFPTKLKWPTKLKYKKKIKYNKDEINFLLKLNSEKPTKPPPPLISEYIEGRRIMPSNTPIPGPWENWRTQYAVEIMDCLSPYNPTQNIDVMSAAQVVKTSLMENTIGFYMGACPAPILFMSGTDMLLNKWSSKRLEPLIDSLGLREKLQAPIETEKSRTTGDKAQQKLFSGGFLEMASAQSPSSMRSDSVRILLLDETDAAPVMLTTGEGYWDEVAEARTSAWGNRRKILACSTPTEYQTSTIYRRFMLGDQCEYFVPCPICGKYQLLVKGNEQGNHGLREEKKGGNLLQVYYLCEFCHEAIFEFQKNYMIKNGKWEPQAKPERLRRSFHLNALLSPLGLYSWIDYWTSFQKSEKMPDGKRSHINLRDGLPFVDAGSRPKSEKVIENRGKYRSGTVPPGVLYLTIGADVQRGSKTDQDNPPRIELEVLGIGAGHRTWSICYLYFIGDVTDPYAGAWEKLHQYALETKLTYERIEDGFKFPVNLIFIDSGDGELTDVVYRFTQRWTNTYPIKGRRSIMRRKKNVGDELMENSFQRYISKKISDDIILYEISTVYYKNQIYNNLKIERDITQNVQKSGFCDFPVDYGEHYFDMLTAEEKMRDGSFQAHGRRNEALDCRVYGLCAADVFLNFELLEYKAWAKEQKMSAYEIQRINYLTVIENMTKLTAMKKSQ
jgi:phage terminase large subunit GpA-like protein